MIVDFLHNQIIRDTVSQRFIESFNENLLPRLCLKYGEALQSVQFYEDHLTDGFRVGGIFHYPLTLVISGVASSEWISWQVQNYRHYDNMNPFTYKGQDLLSFDILESVPEEMLEKMRDRAIFSHGNSLPIILSVASDDKTFLSGRYSQGFVDMLSSAITDAIEADLGISGLSGSGVVLEMSFVPGTYMEHISGNTTYRRLGIKARACSTRDLWVKWTRLDGEGTYTVSDNVTRDMIRFELGEDVPGKIREREYRYLTTESLERYQASMGRKNITEWREMMRRVIRRGEVEKNERIKIKKPIAEETENAEAAVVPEITVSAVTIPSVAERESDDITARLNALLGNTHTPTEPAEPLPNDADNSDLDEMLRGVIGIGAAEAPTVDNESTETSESFPEREASDEPAETSETIPETSAEPVSVPPVTDPAVDPESEIEARIRREVEEKVRAEMEELRRKNREAEELRIKLEEQRRAEQRERELLAEAARLAVLDKEKREADLRAEAERDRIEAERKAAQAQRAAEELRLAEERRKEQERIAAELAARELEEQAEPNPEPQTKTVYLQKTVTLIFRRGGVDAVMTKKVKDIILATIKYLHKENVYLRIKTSVVDQTTLVLAFSEIPAEEEQLIIDIIQVLGKSNIGITKAILE